MLLGTVKNRKNIIKRKRRECLVGREELATGITSQKRKETHAS